VNQTGRRGSQQHNLPPVVSTFIPLSGSKKTNNSTGNNGRLLDIKPSQNSDYGQGRGIASRSCREKAKNSKEDLSRSGNQAVSVISTPNIAIVEEENDSTVGKEEPDFSSPSNPIIVPSKEATTFTISQIHQKGVRTPIGSSQNRYKVSRFIIDDDDDRPRTSPDELTRQKAAKELCNILSETKWHRQEQQQRGHCSNSQLEMLGDLPVERKRNESDSKDFLQQEVRSTIDLTLPLKSSVISVTTQSPRYGRRSGMLLSTKSHDKDDRVEHDGATVHQTELNLDADSVRQSKRLSSSGHGNLLYPAHNMMGELAPQSLPLVPTKKQSTVRSRCAECRKRLNITNVYTCRCDKLFCAAHRYSELHNCTFDYKTDGRKILEQTNPLVTAPKLPKI
jgi:AN1-type zinc finger and ubiquitin domain-containing protein 1